MAPAPYSLQDNWTPLALLALLWASLAWVEGTATPDPNAMKALLNEVAKKWILQKLNMSEPPIITHPLPPEAVANVLQILHMGEAQKDAKGYSSHCEKPNPDEQGYEYITFAKTELSGLLQFKFTHTVRQDMHILQAHLWLYLKAHGRITLQIYRAGHRQAPMAEQRLESKGSGWHSFSLMPAMQNIFEQGEKTLTLELQCVGCRDDATSLVMAANSTQKPFLVVQIREPGHQMAKRSQSCDENPAACCLKEFYVDFRDLGWNTWLLHPEGYQMNYCSGECPLIMEAPSIHRLILNRFEDENFPTRSHPCCIPTVQRAISILYLNLEDEYVKKDISNMAVDACGCS